MRLLITLQQFLQDMRAQKLRTFLTILGITWGTVSVIVLMANGVGIERQNRKTMHGMGDKIAVLFGGQTTKPFAGFGDGRGIALKEDDGRLLAREIPEIELQSIEYRTSDLPIRYQNKPTNPGTTGIEPAYADLRNIVVGPGGRFINPLDLERRRRVVVLGDEIKKLLFGESDAIGKQVLLGKTPFLVIGVMEEKTQNSSYFYRDAERVFIPATTYKALINQNYVDNIVYRVADPEQSAFVKTRIYETLGRKYKFDPTDESALGLWDTVEGDKMFNYFFMGFNLFMAVIGSFTLTVGGIGVANIMYVVVRERTMEIGVKRAMGATRSDILRQFFLETGVIVGFGASMGFLIAIGLVKLLGMMPVQDMIGTPEISPTVAITTVGLLCLIALMAGYFPARRASLLDPVECMRG